MTRSLPPILVLSAVALLLVPSGCRKSEPSADSNSTADAKKESPADQPVTAQHVLEKMAAAYKNATSYADFGVVELNAETSARPIHIRAEFSVKMVRPNKLHVEMNQGVVVTDGRKWSAYIKNLPGQTVDRDAPAKLTLDALFADSVLYQALTTGFDGLVSTLISPQLVLLFDDDPLKRLLSDSEERVLSEPGRIGDIECYRVAVKWPAGTTVFWIDQKTYALRRMVFPSQMLSQALGGEGQVQSSSLVADFVAAEPGANVDPKAFQFEAGADSQRVKMFVPPEMFQLLGQKTPDFKFVDVENKPVTPQSLAGKVVLLSFWSAGAQPSQAMLADLEKVWQKYKTNDKVAMYAVNIDPPEADNKALEGVLKEWKVTLPMLRDPEQHAAKLLRVPSPITVFLLGADGVVQHCENCDTPAVVAGLPAKIDKLLAGQDLSKEALVQYKDRLKENEKILDEIFRSTQVEEVKLPTNVTIAPKSSPKTLRLTSLWKCNDVKPAGNILVVPQGGSSPRIFVLDSFKAISEIGTDGKRMGSHKPQLEETEPITLLHTGVVGKGKRYYVAFGPGQQRFHLFDEDWKYVLNFPADALANRHAGLGDVELGDLDGDGTLKAYVGYWGAVGVQCVSLEGKRLWSNHHLMNVMRVAVGPADPQGRRELFCVNESGSLGVINARGDLQTPIPLTNPLQTIAAGDLMGNGELSYCGIWVSREGQATAVGLNPKGETLWSYPMPKGPWQQVCEPIIVGRFAPDSQAAPARWILPWSDGSIHILSADGKLIDQFNFGAAVNGLATMQLDGKPVLLVATGDGLEAFRVE